MYSLFTYPNTFATVFKHLASPVFHHMDLEKPSCGRNPNNLFTYIYACIMTADLKRTHIPHSLFNSLYYYLLGSIRVSEE